MTTTDPAVDGHTVTHYHQDHANTAMHWWVCSCGAGNEWATPHRWAVRGEADWHLAEAAYITALPGKELRELLDDYGASHQATMTVFPGITYDPRARAAALRAEIDRRITSLQTAAGVLAGEG